MMEKINLCLVIGPVKSGTTMMISLLDGHPKFAAFPLEVKFLTHWFEKLSKTTQSYQSLNQFFISQSKIKLMNPDGIHDGDIMNSGRIDFSGFDFNRFKERMLELEARRHPWSGTQDALFDIYLQDIHQVLKQTAGSPTFQWIVSKEGNHGVQHIGTIDQKFPGTRYIVVVRDPRDVYASIKAIADKKIRGVAAPSFKQITSPARFILDNEGKNFTAFERCLSAARDKFSSYIFVKYEDIVRDPKTELSKIARFLNVPFDPCLLRPTNLDKPWGGNSSSLKSFSGLTASRSKKWDAELSFREIRVIEYFLSRYLESGHYEKVSGRAPRFQIALDTAVAEVLALIRYRTASTQWFKEIIKSCLYSVRIVALLRKQNNSGT